jgi:hypothetical protein
MRFYTKQHPFYCGIDLHARTLYVCTAILILAFSRYRATSVAQGPEA